MKLLLLEDEAIIRNGILKHTPFEELGIYTVKFAASPIEAMDIINDYIPDIILSDIKMPGMTGIEFAKIIKEKYKDIQIIIISGYSDKEYLTNAIHLGVINYIEKPIDMDELITALKKAVEMRMKSMRYQRNILHNILKKSIGDEEFKENIDYSHYRLFLISAKEEMEDMDYVEEELNRYFPNKNIIGDRIAHKEYAFLICSDEEISEEVGINFSRKIFDIIGIEEQIFISIGREISHQSKVKDIYESYMENKEGLENLSYKGWNQVAFYKDRANDIGIEFSKEKEDELYKYLIASDYQKALSIVQRHRDILIENKYALNFSVKNSFYAIHKILEKWDDKEGTGEFIYKFLDEAKTIDEMYDYIHFYMDRLVENRKNNLKNNNYQIKEIIKYIHEHLDSPNLSVSEIAEKVFLTKTYLSALFKKKTGNNIVQYIIDRRIEKSLELLKNPRLKQYEVATMVGYEDAKYFAKIFKKKMGIPPSEYRENLP